jgi:hypothetical protein
MNNQLTRPRVTPAREHCARRQCERQPARIAALVHCHGRFQTVSIVDFSPDGLRLHDTFGIAAREEITVELLTGHRLLAKVAWSMGSRIGAQLVERLSPQHPALLALNQMAEKATPAR